MSREDYESNRKIKDIDIISYNKSGKGVSNERYKGSKKDLITTTTDVDKIDEDSDEYVNESPIRKSDHYAATKTYTSIIRKAVNKDDILESWKSLHINALIPESKLFSKDQGKNNLRLTN